MRLLISIGLTVVTVLLNFTFIFGTKKYRYYNPIMILGDKYKKECIKALNKLWKNEITIVALGVTLCFLYVLIEFNSKIVINTFIILCNIYSFIAIALGIYNYNSFKKSINVLLNKTSK